MLKIKNTNTIDFSTDKEQHMARYGKYYESGVLTYEKHNMLVPNIEFYATQAGVPLHYLYNKCKGVLTARDLKYLESWGSLEEKAVVGAYFNHKSTRYIERMYAMTAVVLRNMVDAKFISVQDLIKSLKKGVNVDSKLVCIPNLCLPKKQGGDIASWEVSSIVGWLLKRQGMGYQTIVFIDDIQEIEDQYGTVVYQMIKKHMEPLK